MNFIIIAIWLGLTPQYSAAEQQLDGRPGHAQLDLQASTFCVQKVLACESTWNLAGSATGFNSNPD